MPKTNTPRRSWANIEDGKDYSGGPVKGGSQSAARSRIRVGDDGMKELKKGLERNNRDAKAMPNLFKKGYSESVSSEEMEDRDRRAEAEATRQRKNKVKANIVKAKARNLKKYEDFSDAVEMVKAKKSTNRNDY